MSIYNQQQNIAIGMRAEVIGLAVADAIAAEEDPIARATREKIEDVIIGEILKVEGNHPDWYSNTLLKLYIEVGNYRAIEHATQIPYASCYKSIQKYMTQLKGKARNLELCQKK
jgi:hypothetical protein